MAVVFEKPKSLLDTTMHYCPGCTHGIIHRLICEVIDEMGIEGDTIGVCPVGCSVMAYDYFACDMIEAPHGRAPAVATGVKRALPDKYVFTYQGDGDLAAIGTAETVHSATRGENIVVIFVNNTIYGMTGGQMAPTTIPGQVTQTTPYGRDTKTAGFLSLIHILISLVTISSAALLGIHKTAQTGLFFLQNFSSSTIFITVFLAIICPFFSGLLSKIPISRNPFLLKSI